MKKLKPTKNTWVTRDGRVIKVKDMKDSHLINTMRMIMRVTKSRLIEEQEYAILNFPSFQGETAQYYAEQEYNRLTSAIIDDCHVNGWLSITLPCWDTMIKEAEKRKLNRNTEILIMNRNIKRF